MSKFILNGIAITNVRDKETNLKSSKRKAVNYLRGNSHKTFSWFLNRNFADQNGLAQNSQSDRKQGTATNTTLPSKAMI